MMAMLSRTPYYFFRSRPFSNRPFGGQKTVSANLSAIDCNLLVMNSSAVIPSSPLRILARSVLGETLDENQGLPD